MNKTTQLNLVSQTVSRPTNRYSWLWLALGAVLLPFSLFQTVIPLAAWLAPVFLLRFARTQRAVIALPLLGLTGYLAALVALRSFFPAPLVFVLALPGLTIAFAYAIDKLLAGRFRGVLRTLVFPVADTALGFLFSSGDFGSIGNLAYSQAGNLPLMQTVSIAGVWGLSFLIAWFAPVANELWELGFDLRRSRSSWTFAAVLAAALLYGGVKLAFNPPTGQTVQVAMLAPNRTLANDFNTAPLPAHPRTPDGQVGFQEQYLNPLLDDLFERSQQAASAGAQIIAWSEAAGFVFKENEPAVIERAQAIARQEQVYLQLGLVFILPTGEYPTNENRAILIGPNGEILWDYAKSTQVLNDGNAPGPGIIPAVDTPYGRLATVICFDADFPALVRQAGQAQADILLVPSSDWEPIAEMHARIAVFRAIENGMALARPTRQGISLAADRQGRLLGYKNDYFVAEDQTLLVPIPMQRSGTLYVRTGDSFAYLVVVGFGALIFLALVRRGPRPEPTTTAEPGRDAVQV